MNYAHLLEAGMLVCFGFSWPLNVIKAYKAGTTKGTSLAFIILIITGYVAGISAKLINGQFNYVLAVYFLNLAIVMTNVAVYIRNKALDKKAGITKELKIKKIDIENIEMLEKAQEEDMLNYSNSLDDLINKKENIAENKGAVLLVGGSLDKEIPVAALAKEYDFNFDLYNKSENALSIVEAASYYEKSISKMCPEGILLHLGDEDYNLFKEDSSDFDAAYLNLVGEIKAENKNCRIALLSVSNPSGNKTVSLMNAHIKAIADAEKVTFINIENAKLWNPESTKASCDFAYSMGLRIRKPLRDVAEILYSYAYHNIKAESSEESLVG